MVKGLTLSNSFHRMVAGPDRCQESMSGTGFRKVVGGFYVGRYG